jgi:hypothetical protein
VIDNFNLVRQSAAVAGAIRALSTRELIALHNVAARVADTDPKAKAYLASVQSVLDNTRKTDKEHLAEAQARHAARQAA